MEWNGMEWKGTKWNGMEWNGTDWNGTDWNGMEWDGKPNPDRDVGLRPPSPCDGRRRIAARPPRDRRARARHGGSFLSFLLFLSFMFLLMLDTEICVSVMRRSGDFRVVHGEREDAKQ